MFKPHRFYQHKRFIDVMIEVKKSFKVNNNRYKVKVMWWNKGQIEPFCLRIEQTLDIKDPENWKIVYRMKENGQ